MPALSQLNHNGSWRTQKLIKVEKHTLWLVSAAITDDDELSILLNSLNEKKIPKAPPEETDLIIVQRPSQLRSGNSVKSAQLCTPS